LFTSGSEMGGRMTSISCSSRPRGKGASHHQNLERTVTGRNVGSGGATSPTDHAPVRLLIGGYPGSETSLMAALCCVNIRPDGVGSLRVI
jgi:hypothetical protein